MAAFAVGVAGDSEVVAIREEVRRDEEGSDGSVRVARFAEVEVRWFGGDLWKRCIEVLIDELDAAILESFDPSSTDPRAVFEATIRGLVHFAARRPELNRIMMHEATNASDRLKWLVDTRFRDRHTSLTSAWSELVADGIVAPIDADVVYHTVIGAASLLYANAPEAQLLGIDTFAPSLVDRHADALVNMFLPPQPCQPEGKETK